MQSFEIMNLIKERHTIQILAKLLRTKVAQAYKQTEPSEQSDVLGSGEPNIIDKMHNIVLFLHERDKRGHELIMQVLKLVCEGTPYCVNINTKLLKKEDCGAVLFSMLKETGEAQAVCVTAMEDGVINPEEKKRMLKELYEQREATDKMIRAIEENE